MKANYKVDRKSGTVVPRKVCFTPEEIAKVLDEEWEKKRELVYAEIKTDVANQVLAVVFTALNKSFGFGKKRLLQLKESTEFHFSLMKEGAFWKEYTPLNCLEYLKTNFGIDLDSGDGGARECYTEKSQTE